MKEKVGIIALLIGVFFLWNFQEKELQAEMVALRQQQQANSLLVSRLKKVYDDKQKIQDKVVALQKAAAQDQAFDWYADITDSPVLKRLQAD
jgi:dynactin complex subunit